MKNNRLRNELKKWMALHEKTATDVAKLTHVADTTIQRFISGETEAPHALVVDSIKNLIAQPPSVGLQRPRVST